jgi:hypothetical protein
MPKCTAVVHFISEVNISAKFGFTNRQMGAMCGHEQYVAHATCGDMKYVPSKVEENPSKDKWGNTTDPRGYIDYLICV